MTDRQAHVAYAAIGLALALGLSVLWDAEISLAISEGLWFELTVYLLLAAFLLEPNYSGGGASTTNAIAVSLVTLGANPQRHESWWVALSIVAIGTVALSLGGYVAGSGSPAGGAASRFSKVARQLAGATGSWRALPLASLALSLATFDSTFGDEWRVALIVSLYCLLVTRQPPHELWRELRGTVPAGVHGAVESIHPPHELVITTKETISGLDVGTILRVTGARRGALSSAIVTERVFANGAVAWRLFAPDLQSIISSQGTRVRDLRLELELCDEPEGDLAEAYPELRGSTAHVVGSLTEGASIRSAEIDLNAGTRVELGDVLWTRTDDERTYWQVADATLRRSSWAGDTRRVARIEAVQIGRWNHEEVVFEADTRSPSPADIVIAGQVDTPPPIVTVAGQLQIGTLPKTSFPVVIDLHQLSRTHAAILGTTGTGKTHLSFALIQALVDLGVKVICVDLTGQYLERFPTAVQATAVADVQSFLDGPDSIAVCAPNRGEAINTANKTARTVYDWASLQPKIKNTDAARCVVLFEEAQNFVPENFVVDDWALKAKAQDTSQVVMESRKFGVGFIIVSQRTAMVTKSALSQCNTVFAFQAVDHTGLDYLEGLCGPVLVKGVPTLPHRTAIVMGRALRSAAPVIAHMDEAGVIIH